MLSRAGSRGVLRCAAPAVQVVEAAEHEALKRELAVRASCSESAEGAPAARRPPCTPAPVCLRVQLAERGL